MIQNIIKFNGKFNTLMLPYKTHWYVSIDMVMSDRSAWTTKEVLSLTMSHSDIVKLEGKYIIEKPP